MKFTAELKYNTLIPYTTQDVELLDRFKDGAVFTVEIKDMDIRSAQQNRALHKYFDMVSRELNKRGHKIQNNIGLNLEWSKDRVKELLWKEFQKVVLGKESTRQLTKDEVTKIYDHMNLYLGERFSFNVEFPSMEK